MSDSEAAAMPGFIDIGPATMSVPCDKLFAALAEAQGSIGKVVKNTQVEVKKEGKVLYKHSYADLASMIEACRCPLADQGITVVQFAISLDRGVQVSTMLTHTSGQWMLVKPLHMPAGQGSPQAMGSALTYARRYQFGPTVGIVGEDEDDDGAAAEQNARAHMQAPARRSSGKSKAQGDGYGARCSGAAAGIAKSVDALVAEVAAVMRRKPEVVFRSAVKAAIADLEPYDDRLPTSSADLLINDGKATKAALEAKLAEERARPPAREPGDDGDEQEPRDPTDENAP